MPGGAPCAIPWIRSSLRRRQLLKTRTDDVPPDQADDEEVKEDQVEEQHADDRAGPGDGPAAGRQVPPRLVPGAGEDPGRDAEQDEHDAESVPPPPVQAADQGDAEHQVADTAPAEADPVEEGAFGDGQWRRFPVSLPRGIGYGHDSSLS